MMWTPAKKILIIAPAWIGDLVMMHSLLQILKQQPNNPQIDVLAPSWNFSLLEFMKEVNQVITTPIQHGQLHLKQRYQLGRQLRAADYDQAIVIPNSFKSAFIPFFAKIKRRTGWLGEYRWGILNDVRHLQPTALPMIMQRYAALAYDHSVDYHTHFPKPRLQVDQARVNETLLTKKIKIADGQKILALCPGAEYGPSKRWPVEYFSQLAQHKLAENWQVWLFGSNKERPLTEQIQLQTEGKCLDLAGQTTLSEAVILLSKTSAVVSNDSGLMHIAGALDRPLVAIYGITPPDLAPPLSTRAHALYLNLACSPCFKRTCPLQHHRCMRDILPEQVAAIISGLL